MKQIKIADEYTQFPGGRYPEDGPGNGTTFRKDFLIPAMNIDGKTRLILDGAAGYPSSFLEEAFGGLVRNEGFSAKDILNKLEFVATNPSMKRHITRIKEFIESAKPGAKATG